MTEAKHSIDLDDTSSMESESFLENQQISTPRRPKPILYWLWHAVLFCLATGWVIPLTRSYHKANYPMGKTPLPAEVFQRVKKTFQPDQRFVGGSNATHHAWDGLVAGHDALYIQNPDEYGLPKGTFPSFDHPGKVGKGPAKFYVVTVLHQMHCLNIIRFHYWQVKGVTPATPGYSESSWEVHLDHCFEYLRQAISCGSAFDIEGSSPLADPGEKGHIASTVTGWGVEHNCIDFEALRNFQIDQEKLYNSTWQGHSH